MMTMMTAGKTWHLWLLSLGSLAVRSLSLALRLASPGIERIQMVGRGDWSAEEAVRAPSVKAQEELALESTLSSMCRLTLSSRGISEPNWRASMSAQGQQPESGLQLPRTSSSREISSESTLPLWHSGSCSPHLPCRNRISSQIRDCGSLWANRLGPRAS